MAFTTNVSTKGGDKMKAIMDRAERNRNRKIKVGIFPSSEYPDGEKVANIGAIQEFGSPDANIPERPFFRQAIAEIERDLPKQMRGIIDPQTMEISEHNAARIGRFAADIIRTRIRDLRNPANSAFTLSRKQGENPLVDTGELEAAIDYEVESRSITKDN